jgi:uncharacterized protein YndB with AHSA1/START domain
MSGTFRTSIEIDAPPGRVFDHFVRADPWSLRPDRETAPHRDRMGEAGNEVMPPGARRLRVTFEARGSITRVELEHTGLVPAEASKHAIGWPHFIERLAVAAGGGDPGPDPWKTSPPTGSVQTPPSRAS